MHVIRPTDLYYIVFYLSEESKALTCDVSYETVVIDY